jgi:hypothetical protein
MLRLDICVFVASAVASLAGVRADELDCEHGNDKSAPADILSSFQVLYAPNTSEASSRGFFPARSASFCSRYFFSAASGSLQSAK